MFRSKLIMIVSVIAAFSLSACGVKQTNGTPTGASAASTSASSSVSDTPSQGQSNSGATKFEISQFYPTPGNYTAIPNHVYVIFNEANLDPASIENPSNWTFFCGGTSWYVQQVSLNGSTATIALPDVGSLSVGTTCILGASPSMVDAAGNSLSGTRTVLYTLVSSNSAVSTGGLSVLGTAKIGSYYPVVKDTTAPTGTITTPLPDDRIFGSVTISATAQDPGMINSGVASVEFWLDNSRIGTVLNSPYTISFDSKQFSNGEHTLKLLVTDKAGNMGFWLSSRKIIIGNYSGSLTPPAGGSGGVFFVDAAPVEDNMYGIYLHTTSDIVKNLQPVWQTAYGNNIQTLYGANHGGTGGDAILARCPSYGNYRVAGVRGTTDGKYVRSIGVVCKSQFFTDANEFDGPIFGAANTGNSFELKCPNHEFVTALWGRSGDDLDQIELVCH